MHVHFRRNPLKRRKVINGLSFFQDGGCKSAHHENEATALSCNNF